MKFPMIHADERGETHFGVQDIADRELAMGPTEPPGGPKVSRLAGRPSVGGYGGLRDPRRARDRSPILIEFRNNQGVPG